MVLSAKHPGNPTRFDRKLLKRNYSKELKEHMLRTAYLEYHKCYNLIMLYASRGLYKLRNKSRFNDQCGGDNDCRCRCASTPPYMDWIYWLTETFTIFELSNY